MTLDEKDFRLDAITDAFRVLAEPFDGHPSFVDDDTPLRAALAWRELNSGPTVDADDLLRVFDLDDTSIGTRPGPVSVAPITFTSLCEHHLMPFHGHAEITYQPAGGLVIGLSKFPRLVQAFARRPQVQERLACQIADTLIASPAVEVVEVVVVASHMCLTARGARQPEVEMTTRVTRETDGPSC